MSVKRRQAGFSLIELMVVVTIVILLMAAAGPGFSSAFADRRAMSATQDVLRIGRQAYWETVAYRRAHTVWMSGMDGSQGGRVELIRGDTNSCDQNWQNLRNIADCGVVNSRCIDWLDLDDYESGSRGPRLLATGGNAQRVICYQPDGTTRTSTTLLGPFGTDNLDAAGQSLGGGFAFTVQSYHDDTAEGAVRSLVFPLGGIPRRLQ